MAEQRRASDRQDDDTREIAITTAALLRQHVDTCAEDAKEARDEARNLHADLRSRNTEIDRRFDKVEATVDTGFKELRSYFAKIALAIFGAVLTLFTALLIHKLGWR